MAFDYSVPYEAVRQAIALAAGLPDRVVPTTGKTHQRVAYRDESTSNRTVGDTWVDLRRFSSVNIGRDETRWAVDDTPTGPTPQVLLPAMCGMRRVCIEVHVRSERASAPELADRIRTRMRLPRVQAVLDAGNVGWEAANMTYDNSYRDADNRMLSEAVMDCFFLFAVVDKDDESPDVGWVEEVDGDGDVQYPG